MSRIFVAALGLLLATGSAHATSKLSCWDIFSKSKKPILTAEIVSNHQLDKICFNTKDPEFMSYKMKKDEHGDFSYVYNKCYDQMGEEIITNRSPYKGNNQYSFVFGEAFWSYDKHTAYYDARLILPPDLAPQVLKEFRFKGRESQRSNAVAVMTPGRLMHQGGDVYLRMFCVSK